MSDKAVEILVGIAVAIVAIWLIYAQASFIIGMVKDFIYHPVAAFWYWLGGGYAFR